MLTRDIAQALGSKEDQATLTGLMALFCVCKKYEFETGEEREQLFTIIKDSHEILGQIIEAYLPQIGQGNSEIALQILYRIIKMFYVSNQLLLCPFYKDVTKLTPWI